jgi:transcriptional regulator with XRE-family HTH domain
LKEKKTVALNENKLTAEVIARGLGEELRHRRQAEGVSRENFVKRLPSGIGDRTLLAYEHGIRHLSVARLIELSDGLGVEAPVLLGDAMQRARVALLNIPLRVDLNQLLCSFNVKFRPLHQWAKNRLGDSDDGVIVVLPPGVRELAASVGLQHQAVADHLAKFIPEH